MNGEMMKVQSIIAWLVASVWVFGATADSPPPASTTSFIGVLGTPANLTLDTSSSDFDTELALYDASGSLLAENDDFDFGQGLTVQSQIGPVSLPTGRYYIALGGFNTIYAPGFSVTPGNASGLYTVRYSRDGSILGSVSGILPAGEVSWFSFDIVDPENNLGTDLDLGVLRTPFGDFVNLMPHHSTGAYPIEVAIFNPDGTVFTRTNGFPALGSPEVGTYYLAVAPQDAVFSDNFRITTWLDGRAGTFDLRPNSQVLIRGDLSEDRPYFFRFEVVDRCGLACSGIDEGETPYDALANAQDTVNGGCTAPGDRMLPALIGQEWCGRTRSQYFANVEGTLSDALYPDRDFYEILLPAPMEFTAEVIGGRDLTLGIFDRADVTGSCDDPFHAPTLAAAVVEECTGVGQASAVLGAGAYAVLVEPFLGTPDFTEASEYGLILSGRPHNPIDVGGVATAFEPLTISTLGSNFDTEIAVYAEDGILIAFNDDAVGVTSRLDLSLPMGTYYVIGIGYNTEFLNNFGVDVRAGGSPDTLGGAMQMNIGSETDQATVAIGRGLWYRFTVNDATPCAADLNFDDVLNFFDVQLFLAGFSSQNPVADWVSDGQFNFFDIQAYLQAFSAGCP